MAAVERIWHETLPLIGMADGTYMQVWNEHLHGVLPGSQMLLHYDQAYVTK
jgi:hypothetical protein